MRKHFVPFGKKSTYKGKTPPWEFPTFIECYEIGSYVPYPPDNSKQWEIDLAYQAKLKQ